MVIWKSLCSSSLWSLRNISCIFYICDTTGVCASGIFNMKEIWKLEVIQKDQAEIYSSLLESSVLCTHKDHLVLRLHGKYSRFTLLRSSPLYNLTKGGICTGLISIRSAYKCVFYRRIFPSKNLNLGISINWDKCGFLSNCTAVLRWCDNGLFEKKLIH